MNTMGSLFDFVGNGAGASLDVAGILVSLLVAFVLSQMFAWTYIFTHRGVSYSQSFVQSLVLLAVVVAMVMQAVGNSIVVAFGLFGALAIIRFRNILKDTRDTAFLFMMIAIGMCAGIKAFTLAILGTAVFIVIVLLFHLSHFGARQQFDGFLTFYLGSGGPALDDVQGILNRHVFRSRVMSQRAETEGVAYTMRVLMRDPRRAPELVDELKESDGVSGVSLLMQEDESEV